MLKFLAFSLILSVSTAFAAELNVSPSSTEITEDENLSLEFVLNADSMSGDRLKPIFNAPDFDEVNVYSAASGMETSIINGTVTVRRTESVIVVLHPKKSGSLKISGIKTKQGNSFLTSPDITIDVRPSGTMVSRPKVKGGVGYTQHRGTLPNSGVQSGRENGKSIFIRTEPSKTKVYKGEQVILTFALYSRVQLVGMSIERYPNVPGFLKEDIDVPAATNRLTFQRSVVNGLEYNRSVLAQYAIYPVKEGLLPIDPFTGKFSYRSSRSRGNQGDDEDDDPFGINNFFQAMQTHTSVATSDRVNIEVLPLPAAGQPRNFSGLVGDFQVHASVDKTTVKMGEPLNIKIKISGNGHAGSLEHLNVSWPQEFEQYEDKSFTSFNRVGTTERVFDYMLVPKVKGHFMLPGVEVSMFNPQTKTYVTRSSQPLAIEVLEGPLGNTYIAKQQSSDPAPKGTDDIRYWMKESPPQSHALNFVGRGFLALAFALLLISGSRAAIQTKKPRSPTKIKQIRDLIARASKVKTLHEIEDILEHSLLLQGISLGSQTRAEIEEKLLSQGADADTVKRLELLLEECENARYAPGDVAQQDITVQKALRDLPEILQKLLRV